MIDLNQEFSLDPGLCYLNHAAVAPWPARTARRVAEFAEENARRGATFYPRWLETERELRRQLGLLINAPSSDIALLKNTSEALSFVAQGLEWSPGDEIIISNEEFPSNRIVWEALGPRGVRVSEVDLQGPGTPEQRLLQAVGPATRMVAISSVQYASGIRLNLELLGRELRSRGVLFCVDAIQSLGAHAFDVQAIGADFIMADGHKWMLGPEGLALFYVKPELRGRLRLMEFGWHMIANRGNFDARQWQPAADATRFECGSPNMLGIQALNASLSLLLEIGMGEIERLVRENLDYLFEALGDIPGLRFLTPRDPARRAGILTFRIEGVSGERLHRELMARDVICAYRGGGVRFSPHFYTTRLQLTEAVDRLRQALASLRD